MLAHEVEIHVISPVLKMNITSVLGLVPARHLTAEHTKAQLLLVVIVDLIPVLMPRAVAAMVRTRVHAVPAPPEVTHEVAMAVDLAVEAIVVAVQDHAAVEATTAVATEAPEVVEATVEVLHLVAVVEVVAQEVGVTSIA